MSKRKIIFSAAALAVLVMVVGFGASYLLRMQRPQMDAVYMQDVTPPSQEMIAYVETSGGFDYYVAYTDSGFEPTTISINKGDTVRWGNNSSHDLFILDTLHEEGSACTDGTFSSCKVIRPGEFWEHTFNDATVVQYINARQSDNNGIIQVE